VSRTAAALVDVEEVRPRVDALLTEYVALGSIATASGLVLAAVASALVVPLLFEVDPVAAVGPMVGIWAVVVALTVVTGLLGSRDLLRRPPLPVLREASE